MREQIRELAADRYVQMEELQDELGAPQAEIYDVIHAMKEEGLIDEQSRVHNDHGTMRQMTGWKFAGDK